MPAVLSAAGTALLVCGRSGVLRQKRQLKTARSNSAHRWLHIAPMMKYTNRHFRCLLRLLSKNLVLWTEMVKDSSITRNEDNSHMLRRILDMSCPVTERPVILQLGGSDASNLAEAVKIANRWGYTGLNLNCGCPAASAVKVRDGCGFGAQLMRSPMLVRECVEAMLNEALPGVEVSVKCRIGTHDTLSDLHRDGDSYDTLARFVETVASSGKVRKFVVHARSGILSGLCPRANRRAPPLKYDFVYKLANEWPELDIMVNGGIRGHEEVESHRKHGVEVMVGRWAIKSPWDLADADAVQQGRHNIIRRYLEYCQKELVLEREKNLGFLMEPLVPLFAGIHGSNQYRQQLQGVAMNPCDGGFERLDEVVNRALATLPESDLKACPCLHTTTT